MKTSTRAVTAALVSACALLLNAGCTKAPDWDAYEHRASGVPAETHLDGAALSQHQLRMRRAHRDLGSIQVTLQSLRRRGDSDSLAAFEAFLRPYLREHVAGLLRHDSATAAQHPDLLALDASVLFAEAEVWEELRDARALRRTLREMRKRFRGNETLSVEYPAGESTTVGRGMAAIQKQL